MNRIFKHISLLFENYTYSWDEGKALSSFDGISTSEFSTTMEETYLDYYITLAHTIGCERSRLRSGLR